jgi:hypothetical protein
MGRLDRWCAKPLERPAHYRKDVKGDVFVVSSAATAQGAGEPLWWGGEPPPPTWLRYTAVTNREGHPAELENDETFSGKTLRAAHPRLQEL